MSSTVDASLFFFQGNIISYFYMEFTLAALLAGHRRAFTPLAAIRPQTLRSAHTRLIPRSLEMTSFVI